MAGSQERIWGELEIAHSARRWAFPPQPEQKPRAAVLGCADSRVPPTALFAQAPGSLFTVRVAGNTIGPMVLASLDFATSELAVPLIVVLGHSDCGAVKAALAGNRDRALAPVLVPISRALADGRPAYLDEAVRLNVMASMRALRSHRGPTGSAIRSGRVLLKGAVVDVVSARLTEVPLPTDQP